MDKKEYINNINCNVLKKDTISLYDVVNFFNEEYISFYDDLKKLESMDCLDIVFDKYFIDLKGRETLKFFVYDLDGYEDKMYLYFKKDAFFYRAFINNGLPPTDPRRILKNLPRNEELVKGYLQLAKKYKQLLEAYKKLEICTIVEDDIIRIKTIISGEIFKQLNSFSFYTSYYNDLANISYSLNPLLLDEKHSEITYLDKYSNKDLENISKRILINKNNLPQMFQK